MKLNIYDKIMVTLTVAFLMSLFVPASFLFFSLISYTFEPTWLLFRIWLAVLIFWTIFIGVRMVFEDDEN